MALTANTLPSIVPRFTLPVDSLLEFASAQTLTATGYVNNVNASLNIGGGRFTGMWALDISAYSGTTPTCAFWLFGSNDSAFGNGNVENLGQYDIALASAQRSVATILGASPTIPDAGAAGSIIARPFTNLSLGGIVYQYLKCYAVMGGTSPSVTLSSWITPMEMKL